MTRPEISKITTIAGGEAQPSLERYCQLVEAAEFVVLYRCGECTNPEPIHCRDCIFCPLKRTLERIKEDKCYNNTVGT